MGVAKPVGEFLTAPILTIEGVDYDEKWRDLPLQKHNNRRSHLHEPLLSGCRVDNG